MKYRDIKHLLVSKRIPTWKLINKLGCSRNHFYDLAHHNFKGSESAVNKALHELLKENK